MYFSLILAFAFTIGPVLGISLPGAYVVHERRVKTAERWQKQARACLDARLSIRIGLTQRNLHLGPQHLKDVSDPSSTSYGKHWTSEQVVEYFAPSDESIQSVRTWLNEAGIAEHRQALTSKRGWIWVEATIAEMEALLKTEYHIFNHGETGEHQIGCEEYSIPDSIRPHVDFITPTVGFSERRRKSVRRRPDRERSIAFSQGPVANQIALADGTSQYPIVHTHEDPIHTLAYCGMAMTPACIAGLYRIPANNSTDVQEDNDIGIVEFGQTYDQADLDNFFYTYASSIPNGTHPNLKLMNGATGPGDPTSQNGETMLDLDIAYPIVYPGNVTMFQTNGGENAILDALDNIYCDHHYQCGLYQPTNVISVSWEERETGSALQTRECNEYMKLGMQGVSLLFASGDNGITARNGSCGANGSFVVNFPSSCPYVTSVGATMLYGGKRITDPKPEVAASSTFKGVITSAGGFSRSFARADYQQNAVSYFLTNNPPGYNSTQFNITGRAYPDVSANGASISTFSNNRKISEWGTSASTPLFASIVTLINQKRLEANKTTVGFLNPALYANPGAFNDITAGNNPGCGTDGFPAVQGWDPITGLGTPIYEKLVEVFMALP